MFKKFFEEVKKRFEGKESENKEAPKIDPQFTERKYSPITNKEGEEDISTKEATDAGYEAKAEEATKEAKKTVEEAYGKEASEDK